MWLMQVGIGSTKAKELGMVYLIRKYGRGSLCHEVGVPSEVQRRQVWSLQVVIGSNKTEQSGVVYLTRK